MVSSSILTKLVTKNFPMANLLTGPTQAELHDALKTYEHSILCQPTPLLYRGSIKKELANKTVHYSINEPTEDDLLARLWLEVIQYGSNT